MIGLGTGDPEIDWEFRHGVKGGMRQLASLECQSQENRSSLRILDLECKWHLSPAGSFKGSQGSKEVLRAKTEEERGIRKLPVSGMDSEVISIGCLHKASQAIRIRRAYSCRIVVKRKSAKQRCRKLACGQRLARPTSLRGPPEKYSGRMVRSSGRGSSIAACAHLALVKGVRQINANGWPTARDGQRGEC